MRYRIPFLLLILALGCARVKLNGAGTYSLPTGTWAENQAHPGVRQFGPNAGGEFGVAFGDVAFCDVRVKYLDLNTKEWKKYAADHGDTIEARAHLWAATVAAEVDFALGRLVPHVTVGGGCFFPSGEETFTRRGITYPYSFFREMPGGIVGGGVTISIVRGLAVVPRLQYTIFPGIHYSGGPVITWMSFLEPGLGVSYQVMGPGEEALQEQVAQRLREKETRMSGSYFNQGVSYHDLGEYDKATNAFDLALIWDPGNTNAEEWLAKTQRSAESARIEELLADARQNLDGRNFPEAIALFDQALALDSANLIAQDGKRKAEEELARTRAVITLAQGHFEAALSAYRKGNYTSAIEEWQKVLAADSTNKEARRYLELVSAKRNRLVADGLSRAQRALREEKWSRAVTTATSVLKLDPRNVEAQEIRRTAQRRIEESKSRLLARGSDLFDKHRYVEAEQLFRAVLKLDPGNGLARDLLTKTQAQRKRLKREDLSGLYLRGIEAYTQEDFEGAIFFWQKVLEIDPNHGGAKKNIERARAKLAALGEG